MATIGTVNGGRIRKVTITEIEDNQVNIRLKYLITTVTP